MRTPKALRPTRWVRLPGCSACRLWVTRIGFVLLSGSVVAFTVIAQLAPDGLASRILNQTWWAVVVTVWGGAIAVPLWDLVRGPPYPPHVERPPPGRPFPALLELLRALGSRARLTRRCAPGGEIDPPGPQPGAGRRFARLILRGALTALLVRLALRTVIGGGRRSR
jgi:hypothetical protein